ncbi:hypothetical protein EV215_0392 [Hypnocyclicus thermotrophus]|uniref:Uncharacterized protein n=1 Tax=Hypnocyclicus thermotrophus TaxID=1627895 RepID=A0AA46I6S2_9FUSO|nr:hypothetical protein [Hypnocyclicus thermotrophus]TDT72582.1 hypothetical protein EV215_0392 [Hypnocyclicus thermotrophus]
MKKLEFIKYVKEICLKILEKAYINKKRFLELNDIENIKKIDEEVIPKFEKLYLYFDSISKNDIENIENFNEIEKNIEEIRESNKLTKEYILKEIEKREKMSKNSGSIAVKRLFEFEKKELNKKLFEIEKLGKPLLEKQKEYEKALADAIQQDEELKYFEKVKENGKKIDKLNNKIIKINKRLEKLNEFLAKKWYYEMYGTISKNELEKIYKDEFKMNGENNE